MQQLRIHFTIDDLAQTTVAARPSIMWELILSLHRLRQPRPAARYQPWLRHVRTRLSTLDLRHVVRPLTTLVPQRGDFPDFLTPHPQASFAESVELIRGTPARQLLQELAPVFRSRQAPSWVRQLVGGDRDCRQELADFLTVYHRELLRPFRDELIDTVQAERARRSQGVLDGGVVKLLNNLSPSASWTAPVLSIGYPCDRDLHLGGRGITLVPSFFCTETPVTLIDPELPPVLVYPVTTDRPHSPAALDGGLVALLGRTRASALRALTRPCSTSELARRIGVSTGTASRHAAALREAGLITSARHGSTMLHTATRLGRELAEFD